MNSEIVEFLKGHGFVKPESWQSIGLDDCLIKNILCNGSPKTIRVYHYEDETGETYCLDMDSEFKWIERTFPELILLALLDMECKTRALYSNNSRMRSDNYHANSDLCIQLYELCLDTMKQFKESEK